MIIIDCVHTQMTEIILSLFLWYELLLQLYYDIHIYILFCLTINYICFNEFPFFVCSVFHLYYSFFCLLIDTMIEYSFCFSLIIHKFNGFIAKRRRFDIKRDIKRRARAHTHTHTVREREKKNEWNKWVNFIIFLPKFDWLCCVRFFFLLFVGQSQWIVVQFYQSIKIVRRIRCVE